MKNGCVHQPVVTMKIRDPRVTPEWFWTHFTVGKQPQQRESPPCAGPIYKYKSWHLRLHSCHLTITCLSLPSRMPSVKCPYLSFFICKNGTVIVLTSWGGWENHMCSYVSGSGQAWHRVTISSRWPSRCIIRTRRYKEIEKGQYWDFPRNDFQLANMLLIE